MGSLGGLSRRLSGRLGNFADRQFVVKGILQSQARAIVHATGLLERTLALDAVDPSLEPLDG